MGERDHVTVDAVVAGFLSLSHDIDQLDVALLVSRSPPANRARGVTPGWSLASLDPTPMAWLY